MKPTAYSRLSRDSVTRNSGHQSKQTRYPDSASSCGPFLFCESFPLGLTYFAASYASVIGAAIRPRSDTS